VKLILTYTIPKSQNMFACRIDYFSKEQFELNAWVLIVIKIKKFIFEILLKS